MKERPILFSGPMVHAIVAGTKTQTRRIVTVPWKGSRRAHPYEPYYVEEDGRLLVDTDAMEGPGSGRGYLEYSECTACPYGVPGDRLWVKETWQLLTGNGHRIVYRADRDPPLTCGGTEPVQNMTWRPSIFMRRQDSRLTLEITGVRVERLQAIGEEDARAEGCGLASMPLAYALGGPQSPKAMFSKLWDSISGDRAPWSSNPWVWVVAFRRVQ